ncbi:hypothetical protein [Lacrimispora sp.]|uniref:hypothetical protein n=1 Tax=Lacrimispora sp. TaxID=2719234 RepID=UPI0028AF9483|nr:hypothetical protein [Lacrimispora sp.]
MVNYRLKLEANLKNKMIFAVEYQSKDIALILFEDNHRPGELMRDFNFLYPNYYASESEWNDDRNLISALILSLDGEITDQELKDDLVCLADSLIEYKPAVNTKVDFYYDPKINQYYCERDGHREQFSQYIVSLCENKETIHLDEECFNHLTQS